MRPGFSLLVGSLLLVGASAAHGQTLKGSRVAMQRQNQVARAEEYTFLRSAAQIRKFVDLGLLVPVRGNADYELDGVSFPYARPALRTFVVRLAAQYRRACGERLVVTSLTRPLSEQPNNASELSVHPAGIAADIRVSRKASCQRWLGKTLLSLEKNGVLDATRERRPPHFHVALFPEPYLRYVNDLGRSVVRLASSGPAPAAAASDDAAGPAAQAPLSPERYEVNRGDSLWNIARRFNTTVATLKQLNNLHSSRIAAGQVIAVPPADGTP